MPDTYLALLRGINVGGKKLLPMKDLAVMFGEAGCHNARTFIQSGNVIFDADPDLSATIPRVITARIAEQIGFKTPIVLRTVAEMVYAIRNNPFLAAGVREDTLHVMFLADQPSATAVATLDPDRSPPDEFIVRGQEIYLRLPNGAARTKLTNAYFDAKLATTSTGRNWRTVTKLLELMQN